MTVRGRLFRLSLVLCLATAAAGGAGLWGAWHVRADYAQARRAYDQLLRISHAGSSLVAGRELLADPRADPARAAEMLSSAAASTALPEGSRQAICQAADAARFSARQRALQLTGDALGALAADAAEVRHQLEAAESRAQAVLWSTLLAVATTCGLVLAGAAALALYHARRIVGPLQAMVAATAEASRQTVRTQLTPTGDRELRDLADHVNRLFAGLDRAYQQLEQEIELKARKLADAQRLAEVGVLAAGVAHEINNPLAVIAGYGQRLIRRMRPGPDPAVWNPSVAQAVRADAEVIIDEAFRCERITAALLTLARPADATHAVVDLADLARRCVERRSVQAPGVQFTVDAAPEAGPFKVLGSQHELTGLIDNLLLNALTAVAGNGSPTIEVRLGTADGRTLLHVADNGVGLSPEAMARCFEPFYSRTAAIAVAAAAGRGTGLGLTVARQIAERHGGVLSAQSAGPGLGATFTLAIPAAQDGGVP